VGVVEAINKDGRPFDEDDLFFLVSMAETVSSALKNASLLLSERKLQILEALVRVSSEITSTLRLDRLLQIIANSPQNVLPYELCAIALDNRGRLQLKAVSGRSSLPLGDAQVEQLQELTSWLSTQADPLHLGRRTNPARTRIAICRRPWRAILKRRAIEGSTPCLSSTTRGGSDCCSTRAAIPTFSNCRTPR